ncbi:AAA family ATPase [Amycolatopsis sp. cg5]|uniref:ATP-binding protein n=1 Tax=Amycolatopsis sp. cg5 TaxID=3238802 RepID=UPI003523B085
MFDLADCCQQCGAALPVRAEQDPGRRARYCSNACRQRAYRQRTRSEPGTEHALVPRAFAAELSAPVDSFLGRDTDLAEVARSLRRTRLMTLTGPEGIGKSRFAIELATRTRGVRPDGMLLVELAAVTGGELVPQTVASLLGIPEQPGEPVAAAIARVVGSRRVLIVLDQAEHVAADCAHLVELLLGRCPGLRVLVTSRAPLGVPGEMIFAVGPLSPAASARLFAERAGNLGEDGAETVAAICERLSGVPLAIELAARLADTLPIGTIGSKFTAAGRYGLAAALTVTHDLLGAQEKRVFRRLSLLEAGFDTDMAKAVCTDAGISGKDVEGLVRSLAVRSLVIATGVPGGPTRYHQLEAIRRFGEERLHEAAESGPWRARGIDWAVALCRPLVDAVFTPSAPPGLIERLSDESKNLRKAVEAACERGDDRELLLVTALTVCWRRQGYMSEGRKLLTTVLARTPCSPADRSLALVHLAWLEVMDGNKIVARQLAERAFAFARTADSPLAVARALSVLAGIRVSLGDYGPACVCYQECLDILREIKEIPSPLDIAFCRHNYAWAALQNGDNERAHELVSAALPVLRAKGAKLTAILHTAGVVALARKELDRAEALFTEGLMLQPGDFRGPAYLIDGLAVVAARKGQAERALRLIGASARMRNAVQGEESPRWREQLEAAETTARRLLAPSAAEAALAAGRRLRREQIIDYARGRGHAVLSGM